jgi:hypothetical protein
MFLYTEGPLAEIIKYCNIKDSFNLISSTKELFKFIDLIFIYTTIDHQIFTTNKYNNYIRKLVNVKNTIDYSSYTNLESLELNIKSNGHGYMKNIKQLKCLKHFRCTKEVHLYPNRFQSTIKSLYLHLSNKVLEPDLFPPTLKSLVLFLKKGMIIKKNILPSSLINLTIYCTKCIVDETVSLPNLQTLDLSTGALDKDDTHITIKFKLPKTLLHLKTHGNCHIDGKLIPETIKSYVVKDPHNTNVPKATVIIYDNYENKNIKITSLPISLKELVFWFGYQHKLLPGALPLDLEILSLGVKYHHKIDVGILPPKLKYLNLGHVFIKSLEPNSLPNSLENLVLSDMYTRKLTEEIIPQNLKEITIGEFYTKIIDKNVLPDTLKIINIRAKTYNETNILNILSNYKNKGITVRIYNTNQYDETVLRSNELNKYWSFTL